MAGSATRLPAIRLPDSFPHEAKLEILKYLPLAAVHWLLCDAVFKRLWCETHEIRQEELAGVVSVEILRRARTVTVRDGDEPCVVCTAGDHRSDGGKHTLVPVHPGEYVLKGMSCRPIREVVFRQETERRRWFAVVRCFEVPALGVTGCCARRREYRGECEDWIAHDRGSENGCITTLDVFNGFGEDGRIRRREVPAAQYASALRMRRTRPYLCVQVSRRLLALLDESLTCYGYAFHRDPSKYFEDCVMVLERSAGTPSTLLS